MKKIFIKILNILIVFCILIGFVLSCYYSIKYWEYRNWYLWVYHFKDVILPTLCPFMMAFILFIIRNIVED